MRQREYSAATQIAIGFCVIGFGLLFLLDNLGWLDIRYTIHFWPMAFIFFGVLKILQTRHTSGAIVGGGLILVGALMTMRELGLFYIGWNTLWPVMLIVVGLSVVFRSASRRRGAVIAAVAIVPGRASDDAGCRRRYRHQRHGGDGRFHAARDDSRLSRR